MNDPDDAAVPDVTVAPGENRAPLGEHRAPPDEAAALSGRQAAPDAGPRGDGLADATEDRTPPDERLEATVIGAVQGVGFRWFVTQIAGELQLRGWVANRSDGTVACVAEGPRPTLEKLLHALARGPMSAQVDRVISAWMPATGRFERFQIRSGSHPGD